MIPACGAFELLLDRRRAGPLQAADSARLETHLGQCQACAAEAEAIEDLSLFASLTGGDPPPGMAVDVRAILATAPAPGALPESLARRRPAIAWLSPLPALASLGGAALLVAAWLAQGDPGAAARPGTAAPRRAGMAIPAADPWLDSHAMNDAVATVEEIRSPTAEVFAFTLAGQDGPTEVVLIVDRSIDL